MRKSLLRHRRVLPDWQVEVVEPASNGKGTAKKTRLGGRRILPPKERVLAAACKIFLLSIFCFLTVLVVKQRLVDVTGLHKHGTPEQKKRPIKSEQKSVERLIETYRRVVMRFTHLHAASWQSHIRLIRDGRRLDHSNPNPLQEEERVGLRSLRQQVQIFLADHHDEDTNATAQNILWDDEEDIPVYFERLIKRCSRSINATVEDSFTEECFGFIHSLIEKPRCTARLDSRVDCRKGSAENSIYRKGNMKASGGAELLLRNAAESLLRNHLRSETINVVILGAGPVGLQLANSLMTLTEATNYTIRVVVFEKRVYSLGHKRPYTRNWPTEIPISRFVDVVDARIAEFFHTLHYPGDNNVLLPINALETLLLLSARHHGVKFLFDNYERYEQILASLPNLVVFDATGHRLDELDRGERADSKVVVNATVRSWKPRKVDKDPMWYDLRQWHYFGREEYKMFVKYQSVVQIAERETASGTLLYPVLPNGTPYTVHFLKVNDVRMSSRDYKVLYSKLNITAYINDDSKLCNDSCVEDSEDFDCWDWCQEELFHWSYLSEYREDIVSRIEIDPPGFPWAVDFVTLTPKQADYLSYLLPRRHGVLPLRRLPIKEMSQSRILQENDLHKKLALFRNRAGDDFPVVDFFHYIPYIYADPVVPGGIFDSATLLRIGDSLFSGDPNKSTGLNSHFRTIKHFVEQMKLL